MGKQYWFKASADAPAEGPVTSKQLLGLAHAGQIAQSTLLSTDQQSWAPAVKYKQLMEVISGGSRPTQGSTSTKKSAPKSEGAIDLTKATPVAPGKACGKPLVFAAGIPVVLAAVMATIIVVSVVTAIFAGFTGAFASITAAFLTDTDPGDAAQAAPIFVAYIVAGVSGAITYGLLLGGSFIVIDLSRTRSAGLGMLFTAVVGGAASGLLALGGSLLLAGVAAGATALVLLSVSRFEIYTQPRCAECGDQLIVEERRRLPHPADQLLSLAKQGDVGKLRSLKVDLKPLEQCRLELSKCKHHACHLLTLTDLVKDSDSARWSDESKVTETVRFTGYLDDRRSKLWASVLNPKKRS